VACPPERGNRSPLLAGGPHRRGWPPWLPCPRCYRAAMGIPLSTAALRLVDGRNYAVLATVNPDGSPQTSVIWVGRDGDDLLFSTVEGRVKHRNMVRDPRVSVAVLDSADPEIYVELRGSVTMTPDIGRKVDAELSWKYDGKDPDDDRLGAVRVVVRIAGAAL
jgi:PPOX class probable F420-dependent enzyme